MPLYDFTDERGEPVEVHYPMSGVPSIGATVQHPDYGLITRVASKAQISPNHCSGTYPYVSRALPDTIPGCPRNAAGKPIVTSRKHERELMARHNLVRIED